jgi:hypothetical protein
MIEIRHNITVFPESTELEESENEQAEFVKSFFVASLNIRASSQTQQLFWLMQILDNF